MSDPIVWQDVECGAYTADLELWHELARTAGGPVLELGAGSGRVALELARAGHEVTALDCDGELLDELARRAGTLNVIGVRADARRLPPFATTFELVIAPMQFLQIMGGHEARAALLTGVAALLSPGGRFAAALADLDGSIAPDYAAPPVPDVAERGGWIYSSLPLDVRPDRCGVAVERLRQTVSPSGELHDERHTQLLDTLTPETLEAEALATGLEPELRREVRATSEHVGSTVIVCRR